MLTLLVPGVGMGGTGTVGTEITVVDSITFQMPFTSSETFQANPTDKVIVRSLPVDTQTFQFEPKN